MVKLIATMAKDIRILMRDKVGLVLMFFMPILLVVIIAKIQNSTFDLVNKNRVSLLLANRDTGTLGTDFIQAIDKIGLFNVVAVPENESDERLARRMNAKDAMLLLLIPQDFSARLTAKAKRITAKALKSFGLQGGDTPDSETGNASPITLYFHPVLQEGFRRSIQGALKSALQMVESRQMLKQLYFSLNEEELPASMENEILNNQTRIDEVPVARNGSRTVPNTSQHNVPAWTIFAMFFVVSSLGSGIVREKLSGSMIRLRTLPTNFLTALLSKQLTYLGVTMIQATLIFSMGVWLFPWLDLPALNLPSDLSGLIVVSLLCGWCAVSYAICVGVFANTQEQANGFGAISIVILAALGGLMVPTFLMPDSFRMIIALSPLHWCLEAYYGLFLEGGSSRDVFMSAIPLFVIAAFLQLVSIWGLKRKNLI